MVNPQVFVRPHNLMVKIEPIGTTAPARVSRLIPLSREVQAELRLDDGQVDNELNLKSQQQVYLKLKDAKAFPLSDSI